MDAREKVRVVREALEALASLDGPAFAGLIEEDAAIKTSAFLTGKTEFRGRDDVVRTFAEVSARFREEGQRLTIEPTRFLVDEDDPDLVVALCRMEITRAAGERFGTDMGYVVRLRDGLLAEVDGSTDQQAALARLGSPVEVED